MKNQVMEARLIRSLQNSVISWVTKGAVAETKALARAGYQAYVDYDPQDVLSAIGFKPFHEAFPGKWGGRPQGGLAKPQERPVKSGKYQFSYALHRF